MAELLYRETTQKIIGAYYDVYNGLGHCYPEFVYENAMVRELSQRQISCTRQEEHRIFFKEWLVGVQRLDILASDTVVVEVKVKPRLTQLDKAQTISYLKTTGRQVGILANFGGSEPEFERVFFAPRPSQAPASFVEQGRPDLLFPELSWEIIGGLFEVHNELGPGFIHRIYANASYREIQSRGLATRPLTDMTVFYRGDPVGEVKLKHLLIEGKIMLFPLALSDIRQVNPENLRRWMASQGIRLGIVCNFHAEQVEPIFLKEAK